MLRKMSQFDRRTQRVRRSLASNGGGRPRLSVFRSSKHIYAQVIDDLKGGTVVAASSMEKTMREGGKTGANIDAAKAVGKLVAERAAEKGVKDVVFDRGRYLYHGRVKALADAAREAGSSFEDNDRWHMNRATATAPALVPASARSRASSSTSSSTSIASPRW